MKGTTIASIVLMLLFPLVFNVLFFLLVDTGSMNATRWVSYAFLHVAFLTLLLPSLLNKQNGEEKVLSWSLVAVATFYFIVECVVAAIFLFWWYKSDTAYIVALITQVVLFALAMAVLLTGYLMNDHTRKSLERDRQQLEEAKKQTENENNQTNE